MIVRCMGNGLEFDGDLLISTWIRPRGFRCHLELDIPYPIVHIQTYPNNLLFTQNLPKISNLNNPSVSV